MLRVLKSYFGSNPQALRFALFFSWSSAPYVVNALLYRARHNRLFSLLGGKTPSAENDTTGSSEIVAKWLKEDHKNHFLQDVLGEESLTWVRAQNEDCINRLGDPTDQAIYNKVLSILDSKEKIPYVTKIGDFLYNFWQDEQHKRGLWRRTTLKSYQTSEPEWEEVLDIDRLGLEEGENWVYKGHSLLAESPSDPAFKRTMLSLSRGGSDATVTREFDLLTKAFVSSADNGFQVCQILFLLLLSSYLSLFLQLPEAKSSVSWLDRDTLVIGTDLKDGQSLTSSGYPRVIRSWKRCTPLSTATTTVCYEGVESDVSVRGSVQKHGEYMFEWRSRSMTFYTSRVMLRQFKGPDGESLAHQGQWMDLMELFSDDVETDVFQDQLIVQLRSELTLGGKSYAAGSLLTLPLTSISLALNGGKDGSSSSKLTPTVLFEPTATVSLDSYCQTKDYLLLTLLDTVKTRINYWRYDKSASNWSLQSSESAAVIRGVSLTPFDRHHSNDFWFTSSSWIEPTTLRLLSAEAGASLLTAAAPAPVKGLSRQFDLDHRLEEKQFEAISADGTRIPYFLLAAKGLKPDGSTPCLLYGYGGFEISLTPSYSSSTGSTWLDPAVMGRNTAYVVANIRGGGEFGPSWHQAALKEKRHKAYEDFIAVAEDLIARGVTSPERLAVRGGSNGGLLMGNMFTLRPDLFKAVCCDVPLLDMRAYHKLLAGASWMAEYGDPDQPEEWSFLQHYSAYHNIDADKVKAGKVPALLMKTSTRDDRVHPYHARCFVKRLHDIKQEVSSSTAAAGSSGGKIGRGSVLYYENIEGGHGGAADNKQMAYTTVSAI